MRPRAEDGSIPRRCGRTDPRPEAEGTIVFERIENGWQLVRQSWEVLKLDKELLVFPLLSGIACLLVMASFALPIWASGFADSLFEKAAAGEGGQVGQSEQIIGYVILFAFYFVNYFVIIFFNTALIACAIIRFKGGNPNLGDGFSAAFSRLPQIAGWALVAATVGLILKIIESSSERVGEIIASLLGMAWSAITYFVVPVIVVERTGPIQAGKRSFEILKRTWGEALVANFGIGFIMFFASLLGILPMIGGVAAVAAGHTALGILALVVGFVLLLLVSLISSAMNSIIIGALYLYASEGTVPRQFDDRLFRQAFAHK
jgi:hypothetical protein